MKVLELVWRDPDGNAHTIRSDLQRYLVTVGKGDHARSIGVSQLVSVRIFDPQDEPEKEGNE